MDAKAYKARQKAREDKWTGDLALLVGAWEDAAAYFDNAIAGFRAMDPKQLGAYVLDWISYSLCLFSSSLSLSLSPLFLSLTSATNAQHTLTPNTPPSLQIKHSTQTPPLCANKTACGWQQL